MSEKAIDFKFIVFVLTAMFAFSVGFLTATYLVGRHWTQSIDQGQADCQRVLDVQANRYHNLLDEQKTGYERNATDMTSQCVKSIDDVADQCVKDMRRIEGRINQR